MDTLSKPCSACKEIKPLLAFNKNRTRKYGVSAECKNCIALRFKREYPQRIDKIKAANKANRKKYYAANPETYARATRARRARKAAAFSEKYTAQDILQAWGADCHICALPIDLTVDRRGPGEGLHLDHVIPLSKGGDDTIANVKPAHGRCNMLKKDSIYPN